MLASVQAVRGSLLACLSPEKAPELQAGTLHVGFRACLFL